MSLSMRAITKSFSSNAVLKGVDFALEDGEIRALIGENGAGKTTLMNILGGVLRPDAGVIELDGKRVEFASPRDSLAAGIAFIHQELNLVNDLNVYENLFLGRERVRGAFTDTARMREEARAVLERMGMALDPCAMVRDLDASYKQVVEIARALLFDARVIIMDEPTTSLTEPEIARVFAMMRAVKGQGVSIVFISHKLREVLEICDTYTVLRDGVNVAAGATRETTEAELARHMVGHEVSTQRLSREASAGEVALEVEGLSQARAFEDISFSLRAGEILGVTGLLGDGRSELVTRSTFGTGVPYVFVYRWNAAEGISQHSGIVWEKADAQLAKLSAPLGSVARAETYHAEDNTVTLTLYTESGTKETTLPLTTDILGEWFTNI